MTSISVAHRRVYCLVLTRNTISAPEEAEHHFHLFPQCTNYLDIKMKNTLHVGTTECPDANVWVANRKIARMCAIIHLVLSPAADKWEHME